MKNERKIIYNMNLNQQTKMIQLELFNDENVGVSSSMEFPTEDQSVVSSIYTGSVDVSQLPQPQPEIINSDDEMVSWSWWCKTPKSAKMSWFLKDVAIRYNLTITRLDVDKSWFRERTEVTFEGKRKDLNVARRTIKEVMMYYINE